MRARHTRKGGFTLIELMIVVAIIGILAAAAIPNFLLFQLRSKTSEAKANLAAIRTAEEGFYSESGSYMTTPPTPGGSATSVRRAWPSPAPGFDTFGWAPEGEVFFTYEVWATPADFAAGARGDLDGDSVSSAFGYVHPAPGAVAAASSPACAVTGAYNPASGLNDLTNTVAACDLASGQSVF